MMAAVRLCLTLLPLLPALVLGVKCPYLGLDGSKNTERTVLPSRRALQVFDQSATKKLDIVAVKEDIKKVLTDSKDWWPADFGNYGPLMIRLAWHCSGSFRLSDGRGGCDGGRIRFDPERSWPDNTNLDKALQLLWPVKDKHGEALTWGDLIILAGTTAIESMGGPYLGFCAGRVDDPNGDASLPLGPTPEQEQLLPCATPGACEYPLGQTTMGLIYNNPEGPHGNPDPVASAAELREVFARMGFNDSETVALLGGGHNFGKTHGPCTTGAGPSPKEDPANPWPGTCGEGSMKGKGNNTWTSGFEGPWVLTPTTWGNEYYQNLLTFDWELHKGPGGHNQWRPKHFEGTPDGTPLPEVMMLTVDVALIKDPAYLELVVQYASDITVLEHAFKHAWYKLTTHDMGPASRCIGSQVPPPQPFQLPLPQQQQQQPDWRAVRADIVKALWGPSDALPAGATDEVDGRPYHGALLITLAFNAGLTYRATDHRGGPNGARYRFPPLSQSFDWQGMDKVLKHLQPIKDKYAGRLTWADLVVFAGTVALEESSMLKLKFCPGRSDATNGETLIPEPAAASPMTLSDAQWLAYLRDEIAIRGLTPREWVALQSLPRSNAYYKLLGLGPQGTTPNKHTNNFYHQLLGTRWAPAAGGVPQYVATPGSGDGVERYASRFDMAMVWDPELRAIAQGFADDKEDFRKAVAQAWTKIMNADRFKGPAKNLCDEAALV